jgi:hypothetical protein
MGVTLNIPKEIMENIKHVYLTIDLFFVNKLPFFITLSQKIDFTTANHLGSRKIQEVFKDFKEIYKYYLQRGFRITELHADNESAAMKPHLDDMPRSLRLNLAAADEHVPEIERRIRVVK